MKIHSKIPLPSEVMEHFGRILFKIGFFLIFKKKENIINNFENSKFIFLNRKIQICNVTA